MNLTSRFFTTADGLSFHVRDSGPAEGKTPLLLLHSLSDNGRVFDAIIAAGLERHFRILLPDGRGRGRSARPETGYSLDLHAEDLHLLLNELGIERAILAGHSFGALLGLYFAGKYPQRIAGLALLDAAAELNPLTPMMLPVLTDRLGRWYPSEEAYLASVRAAPFMTFWDETMRWTFLEDTQLMPDGSLWVQTQKRHIMQAAADIMLQSKRDWRARAMAYKGPALVLVATKPFVMGHHVCEAPKALETAVLLAGGVQEEIPGNHFTMLYGAGAQGIADALIRRFAGVKEAAPVLTKELEVAIEA